MADPSPHQHILPLVHAGHPDAADMLLARYGPLVWSLARRLCPTRADAEDAVQEIMLEVLRSSGRFDPAIAGEATFVAMIARRRLIDHLRKRRSTESLGHARGNPADLPDPLAAADASTRGELSEQARRAAHAMERLSDQQRRLITLSIYHGLSHEKIARATGLPLGTVKAHIRRGLIRLRREIDAADAGGRP